MMPIVLESLTDASADQISDVERTLINRLRVLLRDGEDLQMRTLNTLVEQQRGRRWTDEVLLVCLLQSMNTINSVPPITSFAFNSLPEVWYGPVVTGGMIFALFGEAIVQAGESFQYADNGISLSLNQSSLYQGLAGQMMSSWETTVANAKRAMRPGPKGIGSYGKGLNVRIRSYAPRMWVYR